MTWLFPLKIKEEEVLSSWLIRLINIHAISPHVFCDLLWPGKQVLTRDIDIFSDQEILETLCFHTEEDISRARESLLTSYSGVLTEKIYSNTKSKWIMSLGTRHRIHTLFGQMLCPVCIRDPEPYTKKEWRLSITTECPIHEVKLIDCCKKCRKPITPKKAAFSGDAYKCSFCKHDLRKTKYVHSHPDDLLRQRFFNLVIKHKWLRVNGVHCSSLDYFSFIEKVIWMLCNTNIRRNVYYETFKKCRTSKKRWVLESIRVHERRVILKKLWEILSGYPESFINFTKSTGICWSQIQSDNKHWPDLIIKDCWSSFSHEDATKISINT